ncbi:MAG: RES domain-containing protein, partial [Chloroflexota bacterium]|nr:RES domain-containing protein [Chloroflexota bacterium]
MSVDASAPWIGSVYRHIPQHADVLNFEFAGLYRDNRWNLAGERTLYLAGDQGVLAAEWARRLPYPWPANIGRRSLTRQVYRLGARFDHVVDVRSPESIQRFGIDPSSNWIVDMASTRNIVRVVRDSTPAQAIIVPSIAYIDDHARWN